MNEIKEKTENCFGVGCAERENYAKNGSISGYMELEIRCLTDLHIGNGSVKSIENSLIKTVVKCDEKPIIPGSSLKGCVRAISAAVSHSCLQDQKSDNLGQNIKCSVSYDKETKKLVKNICMTCSIFGTMGYASRVEFSEFYPDKDVKLVNISKAASHSGKGEPRKRMFYRTRTNDPLTNSMEEYTTNCPQNSTIIIEAVPKDTKFYGKIFFRNLTEEQISLLMFSLGLDETVDLLIGGFKYDGMGKIKISVVHYKYNFKKEPAELAKNYESLTDCQKQIKQIRNQNTPIRAIEGGN